MANAIESESPASETGATRRILLFDTTLRDGEQAPGNGMDPHQKVDFALALEDVGVDVIEAGFPASSPSDRESVKKVVEALRSAHVATLNRPVHDDIKISIDVAGTENHHLQIMATGSDIHLDHKRGISRAAAQTEVVDAIALSKSLGVRHVIAAIEDASRGPDDLLRPLIQECTAAGADGITVADTTGCMLPAEYGALVSRIRGWVPAHITVATHCHEDMGLALANALAGIAAGANEVQATLAGIGERAGNTAIEELIAVLIYRGAYMGCATSAKSENLAAAFEILRRHINLPVPRNKAIFGSNAFSTQAGIHQAGVLRAPVTYEFVEPQRFGRERGILVGRHSGRAVVRHVLRDLTDDLDDELVERVYSEHVVTRRGYDFLELGELSQAIRESGLLERTLI
ncbi:LeuA family protein [Mycobacterium sp. MUNTM1]